jgi:hypothetical protein
MLEIVNIQMIAIRVNIVVILHVLMLEIVFVDLKKYNKIKK